MAEVPSRVGRFRKVVGPRLNPFDPQDIVTAVMLGFEPWQMPPPLSREQQAWLGGSFSAPRSGVPPAPYTSWLRLLLQLMEGTR